MTEGIFVFAALLAAIAGAIGYFIGRVAGIRLTHEEVWDEAILRSRLITKHVEELDGDYPSNYKYRRGKEFAASTIIEELTKLTHD